MSIITDEAMRIKFEFKETIHSFNSTDDSFVDCIIMVEKCSADTYLKEDSIEHKVGEVVEAYSINSMNCIIEILHHYQALISREIQMDSCT